MTSTAKYTDRYFGLTIRQRRALDWLLDNRQHWSGYPNNRNTRYCVFGMMQVAGMYSWTTNYFDTGLQRLIQRAKEVTKEEEEPE